MTCLQPDTSPTECVCPCSSCLQTVLEESFAFADDLLQRDGAIRANEDDAA